MATTLRAEFEIIIRKLSLDKRNISFKVESDILYIDSNLDFSELSEIIDKYNLTVETNDTAHVITLNWCSI